LLLFDSHEVVIINALPNIDVKRHTYLSVRIREQREGAMMLPFSRLAVEVCYEIKIRPNHMNKLL
jgi:hypothetical protein